jgi:hypothetical protein
VTDAPRRVPGLAAAVDARGEANGIDQRTEEVAASAERLREVLKTPEGRGLLAAPGFQS